MDGLNKEYEKAKELALTYLSYGMHTEKQVRERLKEKGYDSEKDIKTIDAVLDFLKEFRYVDDTEYAASYIEYAKDKGRGALRIRRELEQRGVDGNTIEDAFYICEKRMEEDGNGFKSDSERAMETALKIVEGEVIDDRLIAKIGRKLKNLGFESGEIYSVLGRIMDMKNKENDID